MCVVVVNTAIFKPVSYTHLLRDGDEVVQLAFSVFVTTSYTHHIIGIFLAHVSVGVRQSHAHAFRVSLVRAEHDGLCHAVRAFQIVGYLSRHFSNAVFYYNIIVVVAIVINTVFYLVAVYVLLSFCWSPFITNVRRDVDYLEWSKEAIFYAIFETCLLYTSSPRPWRVSSHNRNCRHHGR